MTDDELFDHMKGIIAGLFVDAVPTRLACDRLRLAVDAARRDGAEEILAERDAAYEKLSALRLQFSELRPAEDYRD